VEVRDYRASPCQSRDMCTLLQLERYERRITVSPAATAEEILVV
jgi:hypothetical protein